MANAIDLQRLTEHYKRMLVWGFADDAAELYTLETIENTLQEQNPIRKPAELDSHAARILSDVLRNAGRKPCL